MYDFSLRICKTCGQKRVEKEKNQSKIEGDTWRNGPASNSKTVYRVSIICH